MFYRLQQPDWTVQVAKWNPIDPTTNPTPLRLPALQCSYCGRKRVTVARYPRLTFPAGSALPGFMRQNRCLGPVEFAALVERVREELGLTEDVPLPPGTSFGPAELAFRRTVALPDFIWDPTTVVLISPRAQRAFEEAGLTGYETHPIILVGTPDNEEVSGYMEFTVHGNAGRAITNPEYPPTEQCMHCGYASFGRLTFLAVRSSEWDGSDFSRFTPYPFHRIASERAYRVISGVGLSNVDLIPLDSEVAF
jgi:hypothetical protein